MPSKNPQIKFRVTHEELLWLQGQLRPGETLAGLAKRRALAGPDAGLARRAALAAMRGEDLPDGAERIAR